MSVQQRAGFCGDGARHLLHRRVEESMQTPTSLQQVIQQVREAVGRVIVGQQDVIDGVLTGLFAGGHVLLEGVPGLGKTLLVKTLGDILALQFRRIQFTPDLTPTDILGDERPGPIFTQLLLADEINRAQPRTQAALLEAMQEHRVTLRGVTTALAEPFVVLATQNPIEQEGTYQLPEAQVDRFLLKLIVPSPTEDELCEIARRTTQGQAVTLTPLLDASQVCAMQAAIRSMPVSDEMIRAVSRLILATHPESPAAPLSVKRNVLYGASPRGMQSVILAAKVRAVLHGREVMIDEDVMTVIVPALQHRIFLSFEGMARAVLPAEILQDVVESWHQFNDFDAAEIEYDAAQEAMATDPSWMDGPDDAEHRAGEV
jgi:MoxR-like ATPase